MLPTSRITQFSRTMAKRITAYKTRTNLGEVLNEVFYRGTTYVVTRRGKTVAIVSPPFPAPPPRRARGTADRWRRTVLGFAGSLNRRDGATIARIVRAARRETLRVPPDLNA